jgi:3-methyladenine DNA glycosylase AlkD
MARDTSARLRAALREVADPARAPAMQAYMKSAMPYLGVPKPALAAVTRALFSELPLPDAVTWQREVLGLFRGAKFREERYAALALARDRRAKAFHDLSALPMYEEIIVTGAWWDIVDEVASHCLGLLLDREPAPTKKAMLAWSRCDDLWKRRAAILCQLGKKERTDLPFLYACIEPALGTREFFLNKAIGWALRQHAWTDAQEVQRWVRENDARLSALSKREALKNVGAPPRHP